MPGWSAPSRPTCGFSRVSGEFSRTCLNEKWKKSAGGAGRGCGLFFGVRQAEFFHFIAESVAADIEQFRRFDLIAVRLLQSELDEGVLDIFKGGAPVRNGQR